MKEKPTPAPWHCIDLALEAPDHSGRGLYITAKGCTVAEVIPQPGGIDRANARIIANAPRLHAAMLEIAHFGTPCRNCTHALCAILRIAKESIKPA